jgi:hypothetical protein
VVVTRENNIWQTFGPPEGKGQVAQNPKPREESDHLLEGQIYGFSPSFSRIDIQDPRRIDT